MVGIADLTFMIIIAPIIQI